MPANQAPLANDQVTRYAQVAQIGLVLSIGLIGLAPPERGSMLLVPLTHSGARQIDELTARSGATATGVGYLPGSRFVEGQRDRLIVLMLPHGILVLAGAPPFCGNVQGISPQ